MRLAALTRTRIDGDVIEEFVRHTLQFIDDLFVVDNSSPDASLETLTLLRGEGLPLTIWSDDYFEMRPWIMTNLVRRVLAETAADYVLLLDADEFIKMPSRSDLENALVTLPPNSHGLMPWVNYVPTAQDDTAERLVLGRIRYRRRAEAFQYFKVVVSRSFASRPTATVAQGKHSIEDPEGGAECVELPTVQLAHFPVRSVKQIQCKALLGAPVFIAMGNENIFAHQWKRIYERMQHSTTWSNEEFLSIGLKYLDPNDDGVPEVVFDPLSPVAKIYPESCAELLDIAIRYPRELAVAYGRLREDLEASRLERSRAGLPATTA